MMGTIPLYNRLKNSKIKCGLSNGKTFLPLDVLEAEITKEEIEALLFPKIFGLVFTAGSGIPTKIIESAKKVFAILVLIGDPSASKGLLAEGLNDSHLPLSQNPIAGEGNSLVSNDGTVFHSFASWSELGVDRFLETQWAVLAPVLENSGEDVTLDPRYVLPLTSLDLISKGVYSDVYRGELHQAHQKGIQVRPPPSLIPCS